MTTINNTSAETNLIERLIKLNETLYIISGEGTYGHREEYTGKMTVRAIKSRLTRERCHGDRWARIDTDDNKVLGGYISGY